MATAELIAAVRRLGASALELGSTRIALVAADVEELQWRLVRLLVVAATAFAAAFFALISICGWIVIAFWDTHRVAAAAGVAIFFVVLALIAAARLARLVREQPAPFAGTIEALARDRAALAARGD